jgi:hypothetical protein
MCVVVVVVGGGGGGLLGGSGLVGQHSRQMMQDARVMPAKWPC